jgi:hypothetical protein
MLLFLADQSYTVTTPPTKKTARVMGVAASHLKPLIQQRPAILEQLSDLMAERFAAQSAREKSNFLQAMTSFFLGN